MVFVLLLNLAAASCPCPNWCNASLLSHQPLPGDVITVSPTEGAANCTTIQGALDLTRKKKTRKKLLSHLLVVLLAHRHARA